jgi:peptidoglycan hydrolase CwlO-like protein
MDQTNNSKSNQGRKIVIIVIIAILLAANGVLLWQFFTQKEQITTITTEKTHIINQRDELAKQKAQLQEQLDSLVTMNNQLASKLKISDDEIAALQTKINNLQYAGSGNSGASKAELEKLRAEIKAKIEQMAALQKENDGLKSDKDALNSSLNDEKSKEQQLAQDKDILANKVALGSVMTADNFKITGAKFSKSGKESITTSAKSTQKLKICFTITQNLVVDKGTKTVYIRVLGPDKKCINPNSQTFKKDGQDTPYTVSQDINYNNQKIDQCIYWAKGSTYTKGKYIVEAYLGGNLIGTSSTLLK